MIPLSLTPFTPTSRQKEVVLNHWTLHWRLCFSRVEATWYLSGPTNPSKKKTTLCLSINTLYFDSDKWSSKKYQEVPSCVLILISSPYNTTDFFLKFLLCGNIYNIQFAILSILKLPFCGISYIYNVLKLLPLCFRNFFITLNRSSVTTE